MAFERFLCASHLYRVIGSLVSRNSRELVGLLSPDYQMVAEPHGSAPSVT
jgi:hypothetical protein